MKIRLKSDKEYEIYCEMNDAKDSDTCLIMLHGTCSDKDEVNGAYKYLSDIFYKANIATIRFDFIGSGESEVDYLFYTISSAIADTYKVIEYIRGIGYKKIYVLGWSQGASIALMIKGVTGIIALAPALDLSLIYKDLDILGAKELGYVLYDPGFKEPVKLSYEWIKEVEGLDILNNIDKDIPILLIHGSDDDVVSPINSQKIKDKYINSEYFNIAGADHIFRVFDSFKYLDMISDKVISWLKTL